MIHHVALLYHPRRESAVLEAQWLAEELQKRGIAHTLGSAWDAGSVFQAASCGADLLVSLGGDGTIIHVARVSASCRVPLLGVNLGRVGFLAELTPQSLRGRLDEVISGEFWIEERTMLDVEFDDGSHTERFLCLNEAAIARGGSPRAVHVNTMLDGNEFMTYTADAVLVATATGSTAYSLAAGGPILYPESRDFMITPVAPHLHIGRSLIVPADARITLQLSTDRQAVVSIDGSEERELRPSHRVHVSRSALAAHFARLGPRRYFYAALAARLK